MYSMVVSVPWWSTTKKTAEDKRTINGRERWRRKRQGQITSETVVGGLPVELDDGGTTSSFDPVNRILTTETDTMATAYAFSDDGNLLTATSGADGTTYGYDSLERLVSVDDGSAVTTYIYDARGDRIAKVHDGVQTRYLRDGGRIWTTFDGGGAVLTYNIHAGALVYSIGAGGEIRIFHGDPRGSVAAVTNVSGATIGEYAYDPYGRVLASTGGLANEVGFVGLHGVLTDENGLVQMQARYYDPRIRRFLTEDPLGIAVGSNVYAYVGGDPVGRIDPQGLFSPIVIQALEIWIYQGVQIGLRDAGYLLPTIETAVFYSGGVAITVTKEMVLEYLISVGGTSYAMELTAYEFSQALSTASTTAGSAFTTEVSALGGFTVVGGASISLVAGWQTGRYLGENLEVSYFDPFAGKGGKLQRMSLDEAVQKHYGKIWNAAFHTYDDELLERNKAVRKMLADHGLSYTDYLKISAKLESGEDKTPLLESHGLTPALWDVIADYAQP